MVVLLAGCVAGEATTSQADGGSSGAEATASPTGPSGTDTAPSSSSAGEATASSAGSTSGSESGSETTTGAPIPSGCDDPVLADALPEGPGWHELPGTMLEPHCPPQVEEIFGTGGCRNVIEAWSGGVADTCRNRLLFWGGGHNDYYGNEMYALDLGDDPPAMKRLTDPSVPPAYCETVAPDGGPASRHTYNGQAYMGHIDSMFVVGGGIACPAGMETSDTWTLHAGDLSWTSWDPAAGGPLANTFDGKMAAYDRQTQAVIVHDTFQFWSYVVEDNEYSPRVATDGFQSLYVTPALDPVRRILVSPGRGEIWRYLVDDDVMDDWTGQVTGCGGLLAAESPGFAYDDARQSFIGWGSGDSVYELDPDTMTCTELSFAGGPGAPTDRGTFGRFRYFPQPDVFALVNRWGQNAYILRLQ